MTKNLLVEALEAIAAIKDPPSGDRGPVRHARHIAKCALAQMAKSPGQLAYELDCQRKPTYHDGAPRRPWEALGDVVKLSWERNPTSRDYAVAN